MFSASTFLRYAHSHFLTAFQLFKSTLLLLLKILVCFTEYLAETMQPLSALPWVFMGSLFSSFVQFFESVSNTNFKYFASNNVNSLHI